jgi:hypothetical protein
VIVTESLVNDGFALDCTVVAVATGAVITEKIPVTVVGAAGIVKLVLAAVKEPKVPPFEDDQLLNWKPSLGDAVSGMDALAA